MIDTEGKGYITFDEFKLVMESTQNVVNYVDEFAPHFPFTYSITKSTSSTTDNTTKNMEVGVHRHRDV